MKFFIIIIAFVLIPLGFVNAASDYYIKLGGVDGETKAIAPTEGTIGQTFILDGTQSQDDGTISRFLWRQIGGPTVKISNSAMVEASFVPTQAGTYVFELTVTDSAGRTYTRQKLGFVVGNDVPSTGTIATSTPKPEEGKIEHEWKVEEGESLEAIEPDEIDVADDGEPITPDFSILLGGGGDDSAEAQQGRDDVAQILLQGMQEEGKPVETLSLNYEKIKLTVRQEIKLLGFIPLPAVVMIEIASDKNAKVKFPWWAFMATNKNGDELGQQLVDTISNVLKTKHDTIKNSIGNIR